MPTTDLKVWARIGAAERLIELRAERATLLAAFPDLRDGPTVAARRRGRPKKVQDAVVAETATAEGSRPRKRRTISAEGKARIAAAQRLRWKKQKAAAKKG